MGFLCQKLWHILISSPQILSEIILEVNIYLWRHSVGLWATRGSWCLLPMATAVSLSHPCILSGVASGLCWQHADSPSPVPWPHLGNTRRILHDAVPPSPGVVQPSLALEMQRVRRTRHPHEYVNRSAREDSARSGTRQSLRPEEGLAVRGCPHVIVPLLCSAPSFSSAEPCFMLTAGEEKERRDLIKLYHFRLAMSAPGV